MSNHTNHKKGYGSFFSYIDPNSPHLELAKSSFYPENNKLFYTGRHAIKYVIESIKLDTDINTFWLPEYYCQHVAHWLKSNYSNIKTYKVDPSNSNDIIEGDNFLNPNDVILVNNFWGISNCNITSSIKNTVVIEDHSHGWLSTSCVDSKADFCVASLRKSVPAPLGGVAWKPNGEPLKSLNLKDSYTFDDIWNTTALAMRKKEVFETDGHANEDLKTEFLGLINDAETKMHHNYELIDLKPEHEHILNTYLKNNYLALKTANYHKLLERLQLNENFNILNSKETPFGLTLHFKDLATMSQFKSHLITNRIYPSLLWPNNPVTYDFFLNIHMDFRYDNHDMVYISDIINQF